MDTQAQLLVVLVAGAWPFFVGSLARGAAGAGLHPVVLLPGYACSQLDARLTDEFEPASTAPSCGGGALKGKKGWFRLWKNHKALQEDPALVPCYAELLRLVYDPVAGDYHNVPGVETRVVSFGTTRGFGSDDPATKNTCMEKLVQALEGVGYREGENLFGAPYDFRYAPAPPGEASREFSCFLSSLRLLIEQASQRNGNMSVILVTHSLGGLNANVFLNRSPLAWRRRYVKHFVMVSTGAGGGVFLLRFGGSPSPTDPLSFANTIRSFATAFSALPSPKVFGHAPLVITRAKNYSAYDIPEYLKANGFSDDEVARYVTRVLHVTLNFSAPAVPMTCINGIGVLTAEKLVYWDGDFGANPHVINGDGDGGINIESTLALDSLIGADPEQDDFKSLLIHNTSHVGTISDDLALERLVNEVLEANRAI
ncbi:Lecithin-cholesterol acyltransferase-like 1 [Dichanthelium oligosanthes]|uniref:Lecithin-cholesterol acyltransferase-like 1 n=1 Tax=Dichanthelium oligosanthes TaxID=888268 RepID=A0A1E5WMX9_9POAL|nr:Lecithin-cholesterol acyltransferase-like 1 [Dichanthelium oligosanthes]